MTEEMIDHDEEPSVKGSETMEELGRMVEGDTPDSDKRKKKTPSPDPEVYFRLTGTQIQEMMEKATRDATEAALMAVRTQQIMVERNLENELEKEKAIERLKSSELDDRQELQMEGPNVTSQSMTVLGELLAPRSDLDHREWQKNIANELAIMREKIEGKTPGQRRTRRSPFSEEIMKDKLPSLFRQPDGLLYDGTTDPQDHLDRFENVAMLQGYSEGVKCRVLAATLVGIA